MSGDSEPILPILNRRAPVLDRIRERRRQRNNVGARVGSQVAELALSDDEEEKARIGDEIAQDFRATLADELGVPQEAINPDLVDEFTAMFVALDEEDIVDESVLEELEEEPESDGGKEEDEDENTSTFG